MTSIILLGACAVICLSLAIWAFARADTDVKPIGIIPSFFFAILTVFFINELIIYNSPHGGRTPTMADISKEACIDTIYTHHNGKTYVSYKLRWKDDKVWED